jgi:guanylate kinase
LIILCLIGKSASGKTFVRDKLVKECGYKSLVTFTSRPPRKNEKQDITYRFISKEDFEQKIEEGFFAEWKKYDTEQGVWYYGTALTDCYDADDDTVMILTPDGVRDLQAIEIPMVVIYLYSNLNTIKQRLSIRGDNQKEVERRMKADIKDFNGAEMLADRIVYNNLSDDIESVVENVDYWYKKILKEKSNGK